MNYLSSVNKDEKYAIVIQFPGQDAYGREPRSRQRRDGAACGGPGVVVVDDALKDRGLHGAEDAVHHFVAHARH